MREHGDLIAERPAGPWPALATWARRSWSAESRKTPSRPARIAPGRRCLASWCAGQLQVRKTFPLGAVAALR